MAPLVPGDKSTYLYENEFDYYNMYSDSRFAKTWKKGGWDCLRHYEILASGCTPWFPDLHWCPETLMTNFPRDLVLNMNRLENTNALSQEKYMAMATKLLEYTKTHLTCSVSAEYDEKTSD